TLVQGRQHFSFRSAVVAGDANELRHALREIMSKGESGLRGCSIENEKGENAEQTGALLHLYGNWMLKELLENASFAQEEDKEKLVILADLYVKGYSLDWSMLFKKGRFHRVPLPTYPFSGESYWIGENTDPHQDVLRESVSMGDEGTPLRELTD